jgi:hypothetical protein
MVRGNTAYVDPLLLKPSTKAGGETNLPANRIKSISLGADELCK